MQMSAPMPQFGGGGKGKQMGGMGMAMGMGMGMPMGGASDLVGFVKLGQKQSEAFKDAWKTYCGLYGERVNDPARHDPGYIAGFVDYLGQVAQADLGAAMAQANFSPPPMQPRMGGGGFGGKRPMDSGFGGAVGEPPRKKGKGGGKGGGGDSGRAGGGDADKAALVEQVKALQRRDPDTKAAWWAFTDENHGGVHDPNRHGEDVLEAFLANYE